MSLTDRELLNIVRKNTGSIASMDSIPFSSDLNIRKVAFDVFRVENDPYKGLWALREVNGGKHLVRMSDPQFHKESSGDWSAISDYDDANVTLSYKNVPIARFSSEEYGFRSSNISNFKTALLNRAKEDSEFLQLVFKEQPQPKLEAIASAFPELEPLIKE